MNMIQELRRKRNLLWEQAKHFLAEHRDVNGLISGADLEYYDKLTAEVKDLGEEIQRLESLNPHKTGGKIELDDISLFVEGDDVVERIVPNYELIQPCPFCGGPAKLENMGWPHHVYCTWCGARVTGQGYAEDGEEDAIKKWNKRVLKLTVSMTYANGGDPDEP